MRKLVIILLCLCFNCNVSKKATKAKTQKTEQKDVTTSKTIVTEEKRDGGTIHSTIIPESQREKDENGFKEILKEFKEGGLTKTIYYKPDGSVDIDCIGDEIWKRVEEKIDERDLSKIDTEEKLKLQEKEKTFSFKDIYFLYIFLGIAFLIFLGKITNKFF